MKGINDVNFAGKKVLVRVDFNVPVDENKKITDDTRIMEALPTINKLLGDGAAVILMAHFGRPKKGGFEPELSLKPVAEYLFKIKKVMWGVILALLLHSPIILLIHGARKILKLLMSRLLNVSVILFLMSNDFGKIFHINE